MTNYSTRITAQAGGRLNPAGRRLPVAKPLPAGWHICRLASLAKKDKEAAQRRFRHLVFSQDGLEILGLGAMLHDIGMVKIPASILEKPAGLTVDEFELMTKHVPHGLEILEKSGGVPPAAAQIVEQHHERYDGSGYVDKLKADLIGYGTVICAIVDVYDAITADRAHQRGMSAEDALKRMYEWRNKDFHIDLLAHRPKNPSAR